jgi:hypothetical protein
LRSGGLCRQTQRFSAIARSKREPRFQQECRRIARGLGEHGIDCLGGAGSIAGHPRVGRQPGSSLRFAFGMRRDLFQDGLALIGASSDEIVVAEGDPLIDIVGGIGHEFQRCLGLQRLTRS